MLWWPLLLLALLFAPQARAEVTRYAVVVGANHGGDDLEPLRYAEEDAQRMAELLQELGGFAPAHVQVLLSPTAAGLRQALLNLRSLPADEALFLFYYSGHADARGLRLGRDLYTFELLKGDIRAVDAEVRLGILDACRSGAITRVKGAHVVDPFLGEDLRAEGEAWITASSEDEKAQESDVLGSSFFTYYLMSGLRGAADSGDGAVSLNEAYSYAYARTVERTGATLAGTQHPVYEFKLQGRGDLDLTVLDRASARITLPADTAGTLLILREPEGTTVAEVVKTAGQPMTLALPPGRYLIRRRDGGRVYEVGLSLSEGAHHRTFVWGQGELAGGSPKGEPAEDATQLERLEDRVVRTTDGMVRVTDTVITSSQDVVERGREVAARVDWRADPRVAAGFSVLLPGAGQLYHRQWGRGALMLGGAAALLGSGVAIKAIGKGGLGDGALTGPNPATLMGAMVWGWSVSDAALHPHTKLERPELGWTLAAETSWWHTAQTPYTAGLAADFSLARGVSVGLDRTGWTRSTLPEGGAMATVGGRVMLGLEGRRLRPAVFVATGLHIGHLSDPDRAPFLPAPDAPEPNTVRLALGAGLKLRFYMNGRYFVEYELRGELDGGEPRLTHGGALGVHFGG